MAQGLIDKLETVLQTPMKFGQICKECISGLVKGEFNRFTRQLINGTPR